MAGPVEPVEFACAVVASAPMTATHAIAVAARNLTCRLRLLSGRDASPAVVASKPHRRHALVGAAESAATTDGTRLDTCFDQPTCDRVNPDVSS